MAASNDDRRRISMAKPLWQHVESLTRKAFERYGFVYADLVVRWMEVAGPDIAENTRPEKMTWPRAGAADRHGRRQGGTLVLTVSPGRALAMQHETPIIIERINTYYGYAAVAKVRIVQGEIQERDPRRSASRKSPPLTPAAEKTVIDTVSTVPDEALRAALERLGREVLARPRENGDT